MTNDKKIVTQLPLINLWTDNEDISAQRGIYLTNESIREILRKYTVKFVIANVGDKLKWLSCSESFDFWKTELEPHLANDMNRIEINNFSGNYCYVATEWKTEVETPIILLEKYH